jgi:hypothetical protein
MPPLRIEDIHATATVGPVRYRGGVATLNDVARIALALPGVVEGERRGARAWAVNGKVFAWEREFSKADIKRFGDQSPPDAPILAVRTADLGEKEAVLAAGHDGFFTIPHFDGYPGLLIQLRAARRPALREAIVDAWLAVAPPALAEQYVRRRRGRV